MEEAEDGPKKEPDNLRGMPHEKNTVQKSRKIFLGLFRGGFDQRLGERYGRVEACP